MPAKVSCIVTTIWARPNCSPCDGFAGAFAIQGQGHEAAREKHQRHEGEFPIHVEENADPGQDRDRLFEKIAADAGERGLHHPGVVRDARHEKAGLRFVKEIHRVAHHLAEELGADVGQDFVAHPGDVVGVGVGADAPQGHDCGDGEAEEDKGIDLRSVVHQFRVSGERGRRDGVTTEGDARNFGHDER